MCVRCVVFFVFLRLGLFFVFFFNDTATTEIYTLSLHDALPIWSSNCVAPGLPCTGSISEAASASATATDRKSTRLNSSHTVISYAVFCLKKKKTKITIIEDKHNISTRHTQSCRIHLNTTDRMHH